MDFSFLGRGWGVRLLRSKGLVMKLQNEHLFLDVLIQIGWLRGWLMEICGRCTSPPPTTQPLSARFGFRLTFPALAAQPNSYHKLLALFISGWPFSLRQRTAPGPHPRFPKLPSSQQAAVPCAHSTRDRRWEKVGHLGSQSRLNS